MESFQKLIMVMERETLFDEDYFEGFRAGNEVDYESRILNNFKYMRRDFAEDDPKYKQPVVYAMIVNPTLGQVFVYQRSSIDKRYPERRLQGKWSWGIGGHIEKLDVKNENPIIASMLRELEEEVGIFETFNQKALGYINNDTDEVGKVHFGILYVVETNSRMIRPRSPELENGRLRTVEELDEICSLSDYTIEEWSRISLDPLKLYLQSSMQQ